MKLLPLTCQGLAAGAAALTLIASAAPEERSRFQRAQGGAPQYFQPVQPGGRVPAPPAASPATRGTSLPNSTLPENPEVACSVADTANDFNACSVFPNGPGMFCSTQCGSDGGCSVLAAGGGGGFGEYFCSTRNLDEPARCSVLQPSRGNELAGCSISGDNIGTSMVCSVLGERSRKAGCSAANPGDLHAHCSVFGVAQESQCSVFNHVDHERAICSTISAPGPLGVSKTCSTFADTSPCSVARTSNGRCTAVRAAPANSCSAIAPATTGCSVIGGLQGRNCARP